MIYVQILSLEFIKYLLIYNIILYFFFYFPKSQNIVCKKIKYYIAIKYYN